MTWGFNNKADAASLKAAVPYLYQLLPQKGPGQLAGITNPFALYAAVVTTELTARVGTVPGVGIVDLMRLNSAETALEPSGLINKDGSTPTAESKTVYNLSTSVVEVDEYIFLTKDVHGTLFAINTSGGIGFVTDIRWADPKLQYSKDNGATWIDIDTAEAC